MATRRTKFFGIEVGMQASILALQAGNSASLGPVAWGVDPNGGLTPNATLSIVKEPTGPTLVAPHDQWFTVADLQGFTPLGPLTNGEVYDPSAHDITYVWDFGDPGSRPRAECNLPTAFRDTNRAYGKRVAHVFSAPGTYTVTCFAYDFDGHYGTATTTITVADPAVVYAGPRTICCNPVGDSDFTGAPAGAQLVNGTAAVGPAWGPYSNAFRVMFKRGAVYDNFTEPARVGAGILRYEAYGPALERPVFRKAANEQTVLLLFHGPANADSNKLIGLNLTNNYDSLTETGTYGGDVQNNFGNQNRVLVHDCNAEGFTFGGPEGNKVDVVMSNTLVTDWRTFGIFLQGGGLDPARSRFALIGSALHCLPDALNGIDNGFFDGQIGNQNGPWRNAFARQIFMSCTSMFSKIGWSSNNNTGLDARLRPRTADQPSFRGNSDAGTEANFDHPILWNWDRCVLEGGKEVAEFAPKRGGRPGNYVMDKCIILCTSGATETGLHVAGGSTVRNCFFYMPNTPATHNGIRFFIRSGGENPLQPGMRERPVKVYGCTGYSARTTANASDGRGDVPNMLSLVGVAPSDNWTYDNLTVENNVMHAPVQNAPLVTANPVQLVPIPGLTTLYRGPRWNFPPVLVTITADVPVGGTVTFSYPDDTLLHPNGRATNQAYFLTPPGINRHMLAGTPAVPPIQTELGLFSITFGASNITVTNTSGQTWPASPGSPRTLRLLLDRRNDLGPPLARYASPTTVDVPLPIAGSPALVAAAGLVPWDDLFGAQRTTGRKQGAVEAVPT